MADMKISDLPQAGSVQDAQQFEVNDAGNSRRVTFQMLREKIKSLGDGWWSDKSHTHSGTYANASHTHASNDITGVSTTGKAVLEAANAAAARAAIGAGTGNSNLALGYTLVTAKPGNWGPNIHTETVGQLPWSRLSGVPDSVTSGNLPAALGVGCWAISTPKNDLEILTGSSVQGSNLYRMHLKRMANGTTYLIHMTYPETSLPGTWRCMGDASYKTGSYDMTSLFLRIA